jgi:hypothetical protein
MDELKVLLKGNSIEYSETELVIDEEGVDGGPPNSTIVNLDSVFVSMTARLDCRVSWVRIPPRAALLLLKFFYSQRV